jgi:hypothetical protein
MLFGNRKEKLPLRPIWSGKRRILNKIPSFFEKGQPEARFSSKIRNLSIAFCVSCI